MIIELEQDAISRGADLTLLSQYPHESIVVFAPSCLLQLVELRVDTHPLSGKEFLVVEMRVSVSQANPTIAQTLTKRRAVVDELCLGQVHLTRSTKGEEAAALLGEDFAKGPLSHDGLWYNDDNNFRDAITHALKMAEERRGAAEVPGGMLEVEQIESIDAGAATASDSSEAAAPETADVEAEAEVSDPAVSKRTGGKKKAMVHPL